MSLVVLVTIGIEGDVHGFSKQENTTIQIDGDKTINEVFIKSDSIIRDAAQNYINENYPPVK